MRFGFAVLLMCLWVSHSHAQQTMQNLCQDLSAYVPIENARYVSDSAVPADLNGIQDPVLGSVSIPIAIDLAEFFDRSDLRAVPGLLMEPEISNIEINRDGSVYYNGQEITADIQRTCGTPVPDVKDTVVEPAPPPIPKLESKPPKPQFKPKNNHKTIPKKSSVKVFNGPKPVITGVSELPVEKAQEKIAEEPAVKPSVVEDNSIDVEELNAQDIKDETINGDSDDDSILEGQYP